MDPTTPEKPAMRFLSFSNDQEDAEKEAKLKEAAARIEEAISRERALNELVDFPAQKFEDEGIDPANDCRSLYERLQEQKNKKKDALEESKKLSNLITTLDEDDVNHLNDLAKNKREEELRKRLEIHDALEAKKRLHEQKMIDQERQMKESLMGTTRKPDGKSILNKSTISSMMKLKSKNRTRGNSEMSLTKDSVQQPTSASPSSSKRSNDEVSTSGNSSKKLTPDKPDQERGKSDEIRDHTNEEPNDCTCHRNVTRVLGVLPALPIVKRLSCSSDESDISDNELNCRLMPRRGNRRR